MTEQPKERKGIGTRAEDQEMRQQLEDYICEVFQIDKPTVLMKRQITRFRNEGFSFRGMYLTLYFCFNLAEPPASPRVDSGVAIIPYYYDDARRFFQHKKEVQLHTEALDMNSMAGNRVITIHDTSSTSDRRKDTLIDIESIGGVDGS